MRALDFSRRAALALGILLLIAIVATLPMRLALGALRLSDFGLAARAVQGSIWSARLTEARMGRIAVGDLDAGLSLLPLFLGRARIAVDGGNAPDALKGAATVTPNTTSFTGLNGTVPVAGAMGPLPLASLGFEGLDVRYRNGRCEAASGRVRATLGGDIAGISLPQGLAGPARCEEGQLLLALASQSAMEGVRLKLSAMGGYEAIVTVKASDTAMASRLAAAGFAETPAGHVLRLGGSL